ncbi:Phosphotyrosyl phosphatase activator [Clavulina sp. PMI_390]|nr:Phosphotyrosyl phosphatase activator [Clavulina sp. PMI_390]
MLPSLPHVDLESLPAPPSRIIRTEEDVERWHKSKGFNTYMLFLHRLNEAVSGRLLDDPLLASTSAISALDTIESWIDEVPPKPTPQRFGNLAFRDWGKLLEERCDELLANLVPESLSPFIPHIRPYLVESFGSFGRIDYGSGHELSFGMFLLCLFLIRFFEPTPDVEALVALRVFERYLRLVWRLQDVYKLEPAGSHGVWGLDDYHFLPYLWGSAQLRDQTDLSPTSILDRQPLPKTNLYYLCINRIRTLKFGGPFHEHSPQLYSIATGVTIQAGGWRKVNTGMMKMYVAEVLSKRVVVQHTPLGGIMPWEVMEGGDDSIPQVASSTAATATATPARLGFPSPYAQMTRPSAVGGAMPPPTIGMLPTRMPSAAQTSFPTGSTQAPWAASRRPNT